jgi:hypothetical protein
VRLDLGSSRKAPAAGRADAEIAAAFAPFTLSSPPFSTRPSRLVSHNGADARRNRTPKAQANNHKGAG